MGAKRSKKNGKKQAAKDVEEEIDYAATADMLFAANNSDEDESPQKVKEADDASSPDEEEDSAANEVDKDSDDSSVENKAGDDEDSEDESVEKEESSDEEEDSSDEEENEDPTQQPTAPTVSSTTGEPCTFDLRNLVAINAHQINASALYTKQKSDDEEIVTIPGKNMELVANEEHLLEKATDGCAQLISALWQLPVERSEAGPLVQLPAYDESRIPRELPLPPPKKETKWEKFAKAKGIPLNKEKRSRKVFDEATGTWMFRHGYQKANNDSKEWPIMEVGANDDPYADPWEKVREAKRAKVDQNRENRMRNEERSGNLARGTTNKLLKKAKFRREAGKAGGNMDRDNVPPSGLPVDLHSGGKDMKGLASKTSGLKRGKESTVKALLATQRSTASLGRFDKMREGEPERKMAENKALKKRKIPGSATDPRIISSEHDRSLKLFKTVVEGGGAQKEKERKKGRLARGETAYDYEFDDGLGASSFRKKKGRAGAGKNKKMTKKRIK